MNISLPSLSFNPIQKLNSSTPSFKANLNGTSDRIELSPESKEKLQIKKDLEAIGIDSSTAMRMVTENFGTETYNSLINGEKFDNDEEVYQAHNVSFLDRNLTPTEAVVYMAYDMEDYYGEHDGMCYSGGNKLIDAPSLEAADFTPIELAETMNKGHDIITAGLILKGKLSEETAKDISKFTQENRSITSGSYDIASTEYMILQMKDGLADLNRMTSTETDADGKLASGLTRALSSEEAGTIIEMEYPTDSKSLNYYLWLNQNKNASVFEAFEPQYNYKTGQNTPWNESTKYVEYQKQQESAKIISGLDKKLADSVTQKLMTYITNYKLTSEQAQKFLEYVNNEGIEPDEAAYEASFYTSVDV